MYGHVNSMSSSDNYADGDFVAGLGNYHYTAGEVAAQSLLQSLIIPGNDFDSALLLKPEVGYSTTSSSYGSPTSLTSHSHAKSFMQRSVSSHSLRRSINGFHQLLPSHAELLDSESSPVRRAFSAGDLQMVKAKQHRSSESLISNERSIIESMSRACRYSPEEKKERIERYRSKRNHRNFNKKIKYECRKTLADSRPRIRGRFARNEETELETSRMNSDEWSSHASGNEGEEEEDDGNWINLLTSFSGSPNLFA